MRWIFFGLMLLGTSELYAQQTLTPSENEIAPPKRALAFGLDLYSRGAGLDAWYFHRSKLSHWEWFIHCQFQYQKDSREQIIKNENLYESAKPFVFDKINYCYLLAGTYGWQFMLVPRSQFSSLSIRTGLGLGPVLAFLKPYYIDFFQPNPSNPVTGTAVSRLYDHNLMTYADIIGPSDFFQGFDKTKLVAGFRLRGHVTINLAGSSLYLRAIQAGFQLDTYFDGVPIMDELPDQQIFVAGYIGLLIGNSMK